MKLENLVNRYLHKQGHQGHVQPVSGVFSLVFDEMAEIDLSEDPENHLALLMSSVVSAPLIGSGTEFYKRLLEANFFARQANDAFVSINSITGDLVIVSKYNARQLTFEEFEMALEGFLEQCQYWRNEFLSVALEKYEAEETFQEGTQFMIRV
jgi:hypothetical protein